MPISFNTGARLDSGGAAAASQNLTIPAGVLAGDVVLVVACGFNGASGATLAASSTGTAPVLIDQDQTPVLAAVFSNGGAWYFVASGTDAGKVITFSISTGTAEWSVALAAYSGARNVTPVDVHGAVAAVSATGAAVATPALTTGVAGDWAIYMAAGAAASSNLTEPASTTSREKGISSAGVFADICDSNASVGGAGTGIGGASFTYSSPGGSNTWYSLFTVGLAPPSAAALVTGDEETPWHIRSRM